MIGGGALVKDIRLFPYLEEEYGELGKELVPKS